MKRTPKSREEILRAAAELVREKGEEWLTARAIAARLGTSTQPVYSAFANMEELRSELLEEAKRQYHVRIEEYIAASGRSRYESYGMGFVRFAREEKGLFRFLFLSGRTAFDPFLGEIVSEMTALYRTDEATALAFHRDMTIFSMGLATAALTGPVSDEEVSAAFKREFYALYRYYFPSRPPLG